MKYVAPVAEVVALETVSVIMASTPTGGGNDLPGGDEE